MRLTRLFAVLAALFCCITARFFSQSYKHNVRRMRPLSAPCNLCVPSTAGTAGS